MCDISASVDCYVSENRLLKVNKYTVTVNTIL